MDKLRVCTFPQPVSAESHASCLVKLTCVCHLSCILSFKKYGTSKAEGHGSREVSSVRGSISVSDELAVDKVPVEDNTLVEC